MEPLFKICGLSTPESVNAARAGGATHLGFIFFEKSPRHVSAELARDLTQDVGDCLTVAVTVNADDATLDEIVETMKPSLLQLHGSESIERVRTVKERYGLPVIKAFAVGGAEDVAKALTYEGEADMLLVDAKPPEGSDLPGGNGVSFDWDVLNELQTSTRVLLSGGINLDNIVEAMNHVRAAGSSISGIDVSSGVESAPGVKDIAKIEAFLAKCRA